MTPGARLRRMAGRSLFVAPICVCLIPAGAAHAKSSPGDLSPRLAELAKPSVRAMGPAEQAATLDLAADGPGSLIRFGNRVLVDVRFVPGATVDVGSLRAAGAQIVHVSRRYDTVTAAVASASLRTVAAVPSVGGVTEDLAPLTSVATPSASPSSPGPSTAAAGCFGSATSEGDLQLHAADARSDFGVDGAGVKVGILSDSFDQDASASTHAAQDVASGDLPGAANPCGLTTPVQIVGSPYQPGPNDPPASDEGRAMAQIVHDLAPGASLAFATAFNGELSFADNIRALQTAGAKVIADDITYFDEPFFQDGPVAVAVNDVTNAGSVYFSSAGNNNLIDSSGRDIASWEAPAFRDSGSCPAGMASIFPYAGNCMDFDPGAGTDTTFGITVSSNATLTVDLQWAEPWFGVQTDLDLYLLDANGNPVFSNGSPVSSEDNNPGGSQEPFEFLQWENTTGSPATVQLAINRCASNCNPGAGDGTPRLKLALLQNGGGVTATEYPSSTGGDVVGPTIFGHNGTGNAMGVGAIRYDTDVADPNAAPEAFSSRGPVVHYFDPVSGTTPADPIPTQVISKPDVVATDCGATTFFAQQEGGIWRFCGTSAAAPHAAAIAALELSAKSSATVAEVKQAQIETAHSVGAFGTCAVGAGLVNADAAVGQIESSGSGPQPAPCSQPFSTPIPTQSQVAPPSPSAAPVVPDRVAPETSFAKLPPKVVLTGRNRTLVTFRFRATEDGSTFSCKVDRGPFHQCPVKLTRWFAIGRHVIRVKARDAAGNTDPTPAVYRFRVERIG